MLIVGGKVPQLDDLLNFKMPQESSILVPRWLGVTRVPIC